MKWADLKTELRVELDDLKDTPKWSDDVLLTYAREAIADYSQYFPLTNEEVLLTADTGNPRKYVLPTDFLEEIVVQCPKDNVLQLRRERPGSHFSSGSRPLFYTINGTALFLDADPGTDAVLLTYNALHTLPAAKDDNEFELTIPLVDMELIKLYVVAKFNTRQRNAQSRLDRFKMQAGSREDNPMQPEVEDFFSRYYQKIAERVRPQPRYLYRPRKYR